MEIQHPFRVITNSVDGDVLQVLAPIRVRLTIADLARLIPDRSRAGIQLAADRLVSQGILKLDVIGRTRTYRLNEAHLLAATVRSIANARSDLIHELKKIAADLDASYAALFGSAASDRMTPGSDIDILVLRSVDTTPEREQLLAAARERISALTGNDARVLDVDAYDIGDPAYAALAKEILQHGVTLHGDRAVLRDALSARKRHTGSAQ